jgi:hypothetical protein
MDNAQTLNISDIYNQLAQQKAQLAILQEGVTIASSGSGSTTPGTPQSSNLVRNGSWSHSWNSWNNAATGNNGDYEAAYWFSHVDRANVPMQQGDIWSAWSGGTATSQSFASGAVNTGTDTITVTGHGLLTGDPVKTTAAAQPTGISSSTIYWAIKVDDNNFKLASSYANAKAGTAVDITAAASGAYMTGYPLRSSAHTAFNPRACIWDRAKGQANLNQGHTLDAQLFNFPCQPGYTMYAVILVARKNQYVHAPSTARLTAGIYAKENTTWQYIQSTFTPTATVVGTVTTPTSRDYRVHFRTDRGFTIQSSSVTVASAPSNTDYTNGARVIISWNPPLKYGVLYADIYRLTGGTYELLESVATGVTTYIDNNSVQASAGGYPSADYTKFVALSATQDSILSNLAVDGVDTWDTLPIAIQVPSGYDLGLADGTTSQWLRWGITGLDSSNRFDVRVTDGVTNGTTTVTSAAAQFQTSGWNGKTITLTSGANVHTTTIASVASTTSLTLSVACPFTATSVEVIITGGGGDGDILVDLERLSYGENAIFSFNSDDISSSRGLPVVFPNGSTTGGTGSTGGSGDGRPYCVWEEEIVWTVDGNGITPKTAFECKKGDLVIDATGNINRVVKLNYFAADLWRIVTENDCTAVSSENHKYQTKVDCNGVRLANLHVGDEILTSLDGQTEITTIKTKERIGEGLVVKFSLNNGHYFLIGSCEGKRGGIASVNLKPVEP